MLTWTRSSTAQVASQHEYEVDHMFLCLLNYFSISTKIFDVEEKISDWIGADSLYEMSHKMPTGSTDLEIILDGLIREN